MAISFPDSVYHNMWNGLILAFQEAFQLCEIRLDSGILNTMQPSLDQLIQICRTLAHDDDFVRVVLASTQGDVQGDVQFTEVSDGPEYRTELQQALRDGLTALGLLGWEFKDGTLQAKGGLFPLA